MTRLHDQYKTLVMSRYPTKDLNVGYAAVAYSIYHLIRGGA